jgi:3-dehydroquinate dehydratase/shikimate dehydrogenase
MKPAHDSSTIKELPNRLFLMAKICVPVCVRRVDDLCEAITAASAAGDIVEIRADYLDLGDPNFAQIQRQLAAAQRPLILTLRCSEQGGQSQHDYETRRRFWSSVRDLPANWFVDLELDLVEDFAAGEAAGKLPVDWHQVICSHHDFTGVPDDFAQIFQRMLQSPAGIIKIAVQAVDGVDCLPVFQLLDRARQRGREMIAIAMGPAGLMTRILGPSRGSFLTYGAILAGRENAPGQVSASELRDLYRINRIDRNTQIFGIIGHPVSHSLSPQMHNAAFAAAGLNAVYIPFEVDDVVQFVRRMVHPNTRELDWRLKGLSVTAPHKSMVMQSLDWIDHAAREIGAVNTIVEQDGELHGFNLDAAGFMAPLREALGTISDARCAVIGAGGAARACVWALRNEGAQVTIFARDPDQGELLAKMFAVNYEQFLHNRFRSFDLVVNTTPLGTCGALENQTVATAEQLRGVRMAYDLVYNPWETRFIREARAAGCEVLGGIEMLLAQGVEQFKLWTGDQPNREVMRPTALRKLPQFDHIRNLST